MQKIKYDPVLINGDEFTTRKVYYNAHKIGFVDSYYYYRRNMDSTTRNEKNRYRMYESLITDINIYNYALDNHMSEQIVNMCADKLITSYFIYSKKFARDSQNNAATQEKKYAYHILKQIFFKLNSDMFRYSNIKYKIFYILSGGKFNRFTHMMHYMAKLERAK